MNNTNNTNISFLPPELRWMEEDWAEDHKIEKFFPIPYPRREVFRWFFNRIFGPTSRYKKKSSFIEKDGKLNEITPEFSIAFVGDIMQMFLYTLEFDQSVIDFFSDVDLIVGNLEGILTLQPAFVNSHRHNIEIINELATIKPPNQWLLCLSNNHSADFGIADFSFHLYRLQSMGFNIFGRRDISNFLYKDKLNFVSGTMWINQKRCRYVSRFDYKDDFFMQDKFNILFPHWGYEYELYPRPRLIKNSNELIKKWDLIVGHHSHTVQPLSGINISGVKKLIGYSLGNFTSGWPHMAHRFGMILKCKIGKLSNSDKYAVGDIKWRFTKGEWDEKFNFKKKIAKKPELRPNMLVEVVDKNPFFKKLKYTNIDSI